MTRRACLWIAARSGAADVMTHGGLIPGNVLVSDGRLAGILDAGGLGLARVPGLRSGDLRLVTGPGIGMGRSRASAARTADRWVSSDPRLSRCRVAARARRAFVAWPVSGALCLLTELARGVYLF
jgi:hypothetical protein